MSIDFNNLIGQNLICDDCLEVLKDLPNNKIDLVTTSVPYNIKKNYGKYKDNLSEEEYLNWMRNVFSQIKRALKVNGSFFLNVGSTNTKPWIADNVARIAQELFILQNHIVWVKSITIDTTNYGHFKPINSDRYLNNNWEHIYHFTKTGKVKLDKLSIGTKYSDKSNIKRWDSVKQDMRCRGNVWFVPYETINSKKDKGKHPAIFPTKLITNCINLHGFNEDTILLDPFVGVGSSLVAAQKMEIKGIGIDVNKEYIDFAKTRLGL